MSAGVMRSSVYNMGGAVGRIAVRLVATPMLIAALTLENFGVWVFVTSLFEALMIVENVLAVTLTVFAGKEMDHGSEQELHATVSYMLLATFVFALVLCGLLTFLIPQMTFLFAKLSSTQNADAVAALRLCSLVILFRMPQQIIVGLLQAKLRYGLVNFVGTAQTIILNVGMVVLAYAGGGLQGLVIFWAIGSLIFLGVYFLVAVKEVSLLKFRLKINWAKIVTLTKFAGASFGTALGSTLFSYVDRLIVVSLLGPIQLALYAVITSVCAQINSLSAMAVQPYLPVISHLWAKRASSMEALQQAIRKAVRLNAVIALSLGAMTMVGAPLIIKLFIPGAVDPIAVRGLEIAAAIYGIYSLNAVGYYGLYSIERPYSVMIIQLGAAAATILAIWGCTGKYGLLGAVFSNGVFIVSITMPWLLLRCVGVPLAKYWQWIGPPLAGFGVTLVFVWFLPVSAPWLGLKMVVVAVGVGYLSWTMIPELRLRFLRQ